MKFFVVTPSSNFRFANWAYTDDVPDIPEPSLLLYCPYSILQTRLPKNAVPNIFFPIPKILAVAVWIQSFLKPCCSLGFFQQYVHFLSIKLHKTTQP